MRVLNKDEFKLPYLGKEKFGQLMKIGLEYERGLFYIRNISNIESIKDALSEILNEKVVFTQRCLICGKEFLCLDCKYYETCSSRDLPFHCICKKCSDKDDLYDRYVEKSKQRAKT